MEKFGKALAIAGASSLIFASTALAQGTNQPTLKIITPSESQTIYGDKIPVLFNVEGLEIVDYQTNPTPQSGQGHIHLWLDDANPTAQSAQKIIKDTQTLTNVSYGEHTIRAELVANNHSSLKPQVTTTVKFKNAPLSSPSPAATSGFDKKTALVILVVVALVIIAAWWYTKEEDEEPAKSKVESLPAGPLRREASRRVRPKCLH